VTVVRLSSLPGFRAEAPKRNALVLLLYLLACFVVGGFLLDWLSLHLLL
jgi:hypothetical protein